MQREKLIQILILAAGIGVFIVLFVVFFMALFPQGQAKPADYLTYSLEGLDEIPEEAILFREEEGIAVPGKDLSALALLPDGGFAVCAGTRLIVYDESLKPAVTIVLPEKGFALAAAGTPVRLYAGLKQRIVVYDAAGNELAEWAELGEQAQIVSLAATADTVYVADSGNKTIACFDPEGRLLRFIGRTGAGQSMFLIPSFCFDIALDASGALWAVDPGRLRVVKLDGEGRIDLAWGRASPLLEGFPGCCNPMNLAVAPDGSFVTQEKGILRVKLYDTTGVFKGVVAGPQSFHESLWNTDLAVAPDGRVFLVDAFLNKVRIFIRKGKD